MKYYVTCATSSKENILLKIKANNEVEARNYAILKYNVVKVNSVSSTRPRRIIDSVYNTLSLGNHRFI